MKRIILLLSIVLAALGALSQGKGTLTIDTIPAPSLRGNLLGEPTRQPIAVYLPPSYRINHTKRYPVIYYLPGYENTLGDYINGYFNGYRLEESMNSLIANGKTKEVIVVVANGFSLLEGCFYHNSPVTGGWEDFITRDVLSYVDQKFRTLRSPSSRAIMGLSMGGYGAIHLAMSHPSLFSVAVGECAGLAKPEGSMQTIPLESPSSIARSLKLIDQLKGMSRAEAHRVYLDTIAQLRKNRDWTALFSLAYPSAFTPNPALNAPYFDHPFSKDANGKLVRNEAIYSRYDNGFGNLRAKVIRYRKNLLKLRGLAIDYGTNDFFRWIPQGNAYFDSLLTAHRIPHTTWVNPGDHGDLHRERIEGYHIPYCASLLDFGPTKTSASPRKQDCVVETQGRASLLRDITQ